VVKDAGQEAFILGHSMRMRRRKCSFELSVLTPASQSPPSLPPAPCAASSCFPGAAVTPLPVLVLALPQQGFLLISTSRCPALAQTSFATTLSRCLLRPTPEPTPEPRKPSINGPGEGDFRDHECTRLQRKL